MTPTITGAGGGLREQLHGIEQQINQARDERAAAALEVQRAQEVFAQTDGNIESPQFRAAEAAVRRLEALDARLEALTGQQVGLLRGLSGSTPTFDDGPLGWDAGRVVDSASASMFDALANTTAPIGRVGLGTVASRSGLLREWGGGKTAHAADITGTTAMRRGDFLGIAPQLRRPLKILDLISVGSMDSNTVPYVQESGSLTFAVEQTEGSAKAEGALTLTDKTATAVTIAAWVKAQKQSLSDLPALRQTIDNRLRYAVERRLEDEILGGDGVAPNMLGILGTSGIGTVAYDADELAADQVLRGVTTVQLANATPTGIVMNPADWRDTSIAKASGDGHYYSGGPYSTTPASMWGIPVVVTPAIAAGMVLVGDWGIGAQSLVREGVQVLLSDSDQDDFIKNKVTLLAELRAALAVFQPAAFCTVDLAA